MIDIRVTGLQDLQREFKDFSERRLRAAAATALTRTAVTMRRELLGQLSQAFDRPTPYTLRQLRYVGATAQRFAVFGQRCERRDPGFLAALGVAVQRRLQDRVLKGGVNAAVERIAHVYGSLLSPACVSSSRAM